MYIDSKIILELKFITSSIFQIHRKHDKLMATDFLISVLLEVKETAHLCYSNT